MPNEIDDLKPYSWNKCAMQERMEHIFPQFQCLPWFLHAFKEDALICNRTLENIFWYAFNLEQSEFGLHYNNDVIEENCLPACWKTEITHGFEYVSSFKYETMECLTMNNNAVFANYTFPHRAIDILERYGHHKHNFQTEFCNHVMGASIIVEVKPKRKAQITIFTQHKRTSLFSQLASIGKT